MDRQQSDNVSEAPMLDRSQFLRLAGLAAASAVMTACGQSDEPAAGSDPDEGPGAEGSGTDTGRNAQDRIGIARELVSRMSLDEKLSQMLMPSINTWEGIAATDLSAAPGLAEALRRHQLGGLILSDPNFSDIAQTVRLTHDLQSNNALADNVSVRVPYFLSVDQEGGTVARVSFGTRMTGSMAIGATGEHAEANARTTGRILGEELAALGINVDFAPSVDVNNNPANPIIGTRSFSDDPDLVSRLGVEYARGLADRDVVAVFKHFPGHGDTDSDSHTGEVVIYKTLEEMEQVELAPFRTAVESGAEMIMTAHITLPLVDEEVATGDGSATGFLPATMSGRILGGLLRDELGFDGVVITDALEMDAIAYTGLVPGAPDTAEYAANIAEKAIGAGADMLLIPCDIADWDMAAFLDEYLRILAQKVEEGAIDAARVDESATRILALKMAHGILDADSEPTDSDTSDNDDDTSDSAADNEPTDMDAAIAEAQGIVCNESHRAAELAIAREAVTLIKNERALPFQAEGAHTVLVGREASDIPAIMQAIRDLQASGVIPAEAYVRNLVTGELSGDEQTDCRITVGCYLTDGTPYVSDELNQAIASSNAVAGISCMFGLGSVQDGSYQYRSLETIASAAHAVGASFTLISTNLPYDVARYIESDAIVAAYMGVANLRAAVQLLFDGTGFRGSLPVEVPGFARADDGSIVFSDEVAYQRGSGLER